MAQLGSLLSGVFFLSFLLSRVGIIRPRDGLERVSMMLVTGYLVVVVVGRNELDCLGGGLSDRVVKGW